MNRTSTKRFALAILVATLVYWTSWALAAPKNTSLIKAVSGRIVDIPVMVDQVENLAGVKIIIEYDLNILEFKKATKTQNTSSLMHIVNKKKPGSLIIVMAGAKGIKGKGFPLLSLQFETKKGLKSNCSISIKITDVQLMSDKLEKVNSRIMIDPVTILPAPFAEMKKIASR